MNLGEQYAKAIDGGKGSANDGTFQGLRQAIGRSNAKAKWKAAFAPRETLLHDLCGVHNTGIALTFFGMQSPSSVPTLRVPPKLQWDQWNSGRQKAWFRMQLKHMVELNFSWSVAGWTEEKPSDADILAENVRRMEAERALRHFCPRGCGKHYQLRYGDDMKKHREICRYEGDDKTPEEVATLERPDSQFLYHQLAWNLEMFYLSVQHYHQWGDGPRAMDCFPTIVALTRKTSQHAHYATTGLYLRSLSIMLSPRMFHRLVWNTTCNKHGVLGHRNEGDRRLEHANRTAKNCLGFLGHQNITDIILGYIGAAVLALHDVGRNFDRLNGVPRPASLCSSRRRDYVNTEDEKEMLNILMRPNNNVFVKVNNGRCYKDFEHVRSSNPLDGLDVHRTRAYIMRYQPLAPFPRPHICLFVVAAISCLFVNPLLLRTVLCTCRYGDSAADVQDGLYSRWYPIPGRVWRQLQPGIAPPDRGGHGGHPGGHGGGRGGHGRRGGGRGGHAGRGRSAGATRGSGRRSRPLGGHTQPRRKRSKKKQEEEKTEAVHALLILQDRRTVLDAGSESEAMGSESE